MGPRGVWGRRWVRGSIVGFFCCQTALFCDSIQYSPILCDSSLADSPLLVRHSTWLSACVRRNGQSWTPWGHVWRPPRTG